jgi:selenophosphate synthetase-related protein
MKWYDHEDDLKAFSKRYPDTTFILHINGEDATDLRAIFAKNGDIHTENLTIPVPDFQFESPQA